MKQWRMKSATVVSPNRDGSASNFCVLIHRLPFHPIFR
jgi:hypothetical protein